MPRPPKPAEGRAAAGTAEIVQTGAAEVPATAGSTAARDTMPIPAGSVVSIDTLGAVRIEPAAPTTWTGERRADHATGPASYRPPDPPSPADIAEGRARLVYRYAVGLGAVLLLFGLVKGFPAVAWGGAALGAGAALGITLQHPAVNVVIGVGLGAAVAGVLIWFFLLRPRESVGVSNP